MSEEEADRPVSIQHSLEDQEKIISELANVLDALVSRIDCALTPVNAEPEPGDLRKMAEAPNISIVVSSISHNNRHLRKVIRRMEDTLNRVEL